MLAHSSWFGKLFETMDSLGLKKRTPRVFGMFFENMESLGLKWRAPRVLAYVFETMESSGRLWRTPRILANCCEKMGKCKPKVANSSRVGILLSKNDTPLCFGIVCAKTWKVYAQSGALVALFAYFFRKSRKFKLKV